MKRWLVPLAGFFALGGAVHACVPGFASDHHALQVPYAVFEGRVSELHREGALDANHLLASAVQLGSVEVVRSFHGPYQTGDRVPITIGPARSSCDREVEVGASFTMVIPMGTRAPYSPDGDYQTGAVFRALAATSGRLAAHDVRTFVHRARLEQETGCEVRRAGRYAQVSCGRAYEGRDARVKVIFERVKGAWTEVLRYTAPRASDYSGSTTS